MFTVFSIRPPVLLSSIGLALRLATPMAEAAPLLDISGPQPSQSGPPNDPFATQGQWFQDVDGFNGNEPIRGNELTSRRNEFYDNRTGSGGGFAGTNSITGILTRNSLQFDNNGLVAGFVIRASITNDLPSQGDWLHGTNSHQETNQNPTGYSKLVNAKLTAEFADDGVKGNFPASGAPNFGPESNIFAKNYDELAWYSFSGPAVVEGAFQVPTWDFGTILPGKTTTRDLQFGLYEAVTLATIEFLLDKDIFMNRTTDLKIGDYFEKGNLAVTQPSYEGLAVDDGSAYPDWINRSGNVSVFADVPEPASLALMIAGFAGFAAMGRRKKA